jgi:hypothetical protein
MTFMNVKRAGRMGVPYRGRLYSASWAVDNSTLTPIFPSSTNHFAKALDQKTAKWRYFSAAAAGPATLLTVAGMLKDLLTQSSNNQAFR